MEIKVVDSEKFSGIQCEESGVCVDFYEPSVEAIEQSCIVGLIEDEVPDVSSFGEEFFADQWVAHYEKVTLEDETLCTDEMIESFDGAYVAYEYTSSGIDSATAYFVVPAVKEKSVSLVSQ